MKKGEKQLSITSLSSITIYMIYHQRSITHKDIIYFAGLNKPVDEIIPTIVTALHTYRFASVTSSLSLHFSSPLI